MIFSTLKNIFAFFRKNVIGILLIAPFLMLKIDASYAKYDIKDVRIGAGVGNVRIVFDAKKEFRYKVFLLDEPKRLVVDVMDSSVSPSIDGSLVSNNGLVEALRVGPLQDGSNRFVFDLKKAASVKKTFMLQPQSTFGWRFVVDIASSSEGEFRDSLGNDNSLSNGGVVLPTKEDNTNKQNNSGKTSKKRIVVLDPGHGGKDPGAIGFSGVYEKNITLAMAKELKAIFDKDPRYKVYLTRSTDKFIMLGERVKIARKYDADLFLSIHADSAKNRSAIGLSVYTLSETASDREAAALAERENKADIIAGLNLVEHSKEVSDILINLAQRETMNRSSEFAEFMVGEMKKNAKLVSDTHRFAGFAVLKAPDIPSVLLEMGYLSNRNEERLLKQKPYRNKMAIATKKAVDRYFDSMD